MLLNKLKWAGASVLMVVVLGTAVESAVYLNQAVETDKPKAPAKETKETKAPRPHPKTTVQSARILSDALDAARTIKDENWKANMLMVIAGEQAKTGDKTAAARSCKEALDAAKEIVGIVRYHATLEIAGYMARAGDIEGGRKIAEAIEEVDSRDYGLMQVAEAQARAGDVNGAISTAETIRFARPKNATLRAVVEVHTEAGRLKEASKLAASITEDFDRALALVAIAKARAKAKDRAAARKDLAEALKIAEGIEEGYEGRSAAYACVAAAQAEIEDVEEALKTADAIKGEIWKDEALRDVAIAQVKAGDLQGALKTAETIPGEYTKGEAMKKIVAARLRAGDVKEATKTAESIASVAWRVRSLLEIAKLQTKASDRAAADKTFQKAFEEAVNVQDDGPGMSNIRNAVLSDIVQAQVEMGAEKEALAWAAKQDSALLKTQALLGIAKGLAQRQQALRRSRE